jgi:hypothetical protein
VAKTVVILAALAALLVACGKPGTAVVRYDRVKTRVCLAHQAGVRIGGKLDFVASTATGGAFRARVPGNLVTIVFGQTLGDADNIEQAYVRFHARNVGITDVLRQQGNVIMLWKQHPEDAQLNLVQGCLTS